MVQLNTQKKRWLVGAINNTRRGILMTDLSKTNIGKPARTQDKSYWIEYAERLEADKANCYMKAYRAGWNDALHELAIDGAEEIKTRLYIYANKMKR